MELDIERYYCAAEPNDLACIKHINPTFGDSYIFTRVLEVRNFLVATPFGSFWAVSGESCEPIWRRDSNELVIPTLRRLEIAELHSLRSYGKLSDRWEDLRVARAILEGRARKMPRAARTVGLTLEEAEAELAAAHAHWRSIDEVVQSTHDSLRIRRDASIRLSIARANYERLSHPTESGQGRSEAAGQGSGADLHKYNLKSNSAFLARGASMGLQLRKSFQLEGQTVNSTAYVPEIADRKDKRE